MDWKKKGTFCAKVPYFFFTRKSLCPLTHSKLWRVVFFFSENQKKKIQPYFFFPEKVYLHSLNFFGGGHIKNKLKKPYFSKSGSFNPKYVVFFFLPCSIFFVHVFFLSWKYTVFTHSHNFVENVPKIIFFKKKKKYDTFG